jgi:hypothetical protein
MTPMPKANARVPHPLRRLEVVGDAEPDEVPVLARRHQTEPGTAGLTVAVPEVRLGDLDVSGQPQVITLLLQSRARSGPQSQTAVLTAVI